MIGRSLASTLLVTLASGPGLAQGAPSLPPVAPAFEFAQMLSETGFYTSTKDKEIAPGFVPYSVNSELWTDGASKDRFLRVPEGRHVEFRPDGEWGFPVGTTFLQTLYFDDPADGRVFMETRIIVRGARDLHFASYLWDDDAEDAELVGEFGDETYAIYGDISQSWSVVARDDCSQCHNEFVDARTLGVTTEQMNRIGPDGETNQLVWLAERGVLRGLPDAVDGLPVLADPRDDSAALDHRVRSYLATNCSACHQPQGEGSGTMDLRVDVPLHETGLLSRAIVRPGQPRGSRVLGRMVSLDIDRMPNLISTVVDEEAVKMIAKWIEELPERPPTPSAPSRSAGSGAGGMR